MCSQYIGLAYSYILARKKSYASKLAIAFQHNWDPVAIKHPGDRCAFYADIHSLFYERTIKHIGGSISFYFITRGIGSNRLYNAYFFLTPIDCKAR
jgi:hypothetical protein